MIRKGEKVLLSGLTRGRLTNRFVIMKNKTWCDKQYLNDEREEERCPITLDQEESF